jgi:hypothetical protein
MRRTRLVAGVLALLGSCRLAEASVPVYFANRCPHPLWVRFTYEDSTTLAAGGDESIAFRAEPSGTTLGPAAIGPPSPDGVLLLEVYGDRRYVRRVGARPYHRPPYEQRDGRRALVFDGSIVFCRGRR